MKEARKNLAVFVAIYLFSVAVYFWWVRVLYTHLPWGAVLFVLATSPTIVYLLCLLSEQDKEQDAKDKADTDSAG